MRRPFRRQEKEEEKVEEKEEREERFMKGRVATSTIKKRAEKQTGDEKKTAMQRSMLIIVP